MKVMDLVAKAGGTIKYMNGSWFVIKHGVCLISESMFTHEFFKLSQEIDLPYSENMLAEFNSRLTYMNFPENLSLEESDKYNKSMIEDHQHYSVHAHTYFTFLIAGCSVEACMELMAHNEAQVARLTTSNTKAMDDPIYYSGGDMAVENQIWSDKKSKLDYGVKSRMMRNALNPGLKSIALNYTMSLKDFHKLFIGRISEKGVEPEVRLICERMCEILHKKNPLVIKSPNEYLAISNGQKLKT